MLASAHRFTWLRHLLTNRSGPGFHDCRIWLSFCSPAFAVAPLPTAGEFQKAWVRGASYRTKIKLRPQRPMRRGVLSVVAFALRSADGPVSFVQDMGRRGPGWKRFSPHQPIAAIATSSTELFASEQVMLYAALLHLRLDRYRMEMP